MTILFTDIVGSTRRAAAMGDQPWRRQLDQHDDTARRVVSAFGGRVVETTGDGVLATFDGPGSAVPAAVALGAELRAAGLEIRAGVHTGEVLVSRTVRDILIGSGLRLAPLGARAFKGVPGEWEVFAVRP